MSSLSSSQILSVGPAANRADVHALLQRQGYEILTVAAAEDAGPILARRKIACVLVDAAAAGARLTFLADLLRTEPSIAVIVLAEQPDVAGAVESLRLGAMDYLPAGAPPGDVLASAQRAIERGQALERERAMVQILGEEIGTLAAKLRRERKRHEEVALAAMESLVCVVEAQDPWFGGHSVRVAQTAASLAAELGRSDAEIEQVRLAGRLHDIGLVGVGDGILSKQGPLTPEEFERVRAHVTLCSRILAPLPGLGPVVSFVRHHHERWDGEGYPDRLAAEAVPWGARLIGVAEIYDALTTARPYRKHMTPDLAVEYMHTLVGRAIGSDEWRALAAVVERREALVFVEDAQAPSLVGAAAATLHL